MKLSDFTSLRYSAGGHPLTRAFSQRLGAGLAFTAWKLKLSPSAVTILGLAVFVLASAAYAAWPAGIVPALACTLLLQLAYALDCADGQLARATQRTSAFGAWLDVACDYLRNAALTAALCGWLLRNAVPPWWVVAGAGLYLAGSCVHLHTVTVLRSARPAAELPDVPSTPRFAITLLCDTAGILLLIGLMRLAPQWLAGYAAAAGALLLAVSAALARRRLS